MEEYYYYERSERANTQGKHRVKTVCLLDDNGIFSKGIAICSQSDEIDPAKGKKLSLMRALYSWFVNTNLANGDNRFLVGMNHDTVLDEMTEHEAKILGYVK